MYPHQAHLNYLTGYACYLHAVANPDSKTANQKEVTGDGEDHVLKRDSYTCSDQAGESRDRPEFAGESKSHNDGDHEPENNFAQQQELVAASRIVNIAENGAPPSFRERVYKDQGNCQHSQTDQQAAKFRAGATFQRSLPVADIRAVKAEQDALLAQRQHRG